MNKRNKQFIAGLPREKIITFCKKWKVEELSFFGSVLTDNFGPKSDIDVLVKYSPNSGWSLLDHVAAQRELASIVGRSVDLVSKRAIERSQSEHRRQEILGTAKVYYAEKEAA